MGQITEGLGQPPLGHGVGGEALMEHANGRFQTLITEIRIEHRQIGRH
jgi:hypothetical protein